MTSIALLLITLSTAEEPVAAYQEEPVRARRQFALTGEAGWNSLAGLGVNFSYHAMPHFSADVGLGFSAMGIKGGIRARGNLLTSALTPFAGVGLLYTSGSLGGDVVVRDENDSNEVTIRLKPSPFLRATQTPS